jgi:hypothetical protein
MSTKHVTALATAALAAVLLTGCASGAGPGGAESGKSDSGSAGSATSSAPTATKEASQSKAEACTAFEDRVKSASEGLQTSVAKLQSDPGAAVARLKELDTSIGDAVDAVSEPEVKAKATAFHSAYSQMVTRLEGLAADPGSADASSFQDSATAVQTAAKDIDTTCAS